MALLEWLSIVQFAGLVELGVRTPGSLPHRSDGPDHQSVDDYEDDEACQEVGRDHRCKRHHQLPYVPPELNRLLFRDG